MRHPNEGTLRRLVDEPAGVADADRNHVLGCPECLSAVAEARADATATDAALDVDLAVDVDRAWHHVSGAVALEEGRRAPGVSPGASPTPRWRAALRSPVAAAVGVVALLAGAGVAAASDWLQIFRTEQVAPVNVTQADLVELPDLSAYGTLEVTQEADVREVPDAAAAEEATGLTVPQVSELPQGVSGEPSFRVGDQVNAVFTFSVEKASQAAEAAGETLPPPPPGLDGSQFQLAAGPGVAEAWLDPRGVPELIVARAVAPTAFSDGVSFETARDYLLSLPGLPEDVASQLRSFSGDGTTLPVPVPVEEMSSSAAEVGGQPATLLTSRDGALAAVVWVEDGIVTAVAGLLSADDVLSVANGLQ
jgi:hypothetical protein